VNILSRNLLLLCTLLLSGVVKGQIITTVAGNGVAGYSGDGGPATAATYGYTNGIAVDALGNFYIADQNNHRVRKVDFATSIINTVAGTGVAGFGGDGGSASTAQLNMPEHIAFDSHGNMFISDVINRRIRKIEISTGIITTFAGNGVMGSSGDGGPATSASLYTPQGLKFDKVGNLYITDLGAQKIRAIDTFGTITTVAGNGTPGFSGDGGIATVAQLNSPRDIAIDSVGNIYIADANNNRIRKVEMSTGIITTCAGNATGGYTGDGIPATASGFAGPYSIDFDSHGNLFVDDKSNYRVRKVNALGIIYTVAGNGIAAYGGDGGLATSAQLYYPEGVRLDICDNLLIADQANRRIRKVTFNPFAIPTINITGTPSASTGTTVTVNATVAGAGSSYVVRWFRNSAFLTTTTIPTLSYTKSAGIDTITARVVSTAIGCYDSTLSAPHIITDAVGLMPVSSVSGFDIYPDPAHNNITISAGAVIAHISICDLLGQTVVSKDCNTANMQMDVAALSAGIYLVKVTDGMGGSVVRRLCKE